MRRLGATTVLTPPGEVYQAMSSGTVDAAELIGPWNDQAFALFRVADYYYLPGFHEIGPTAELLINQEAWDGLADDLKAVVEAAAIASAMEYNADYRFHNVKALGPLVEKQGVQLRRFPDEVNQAIGKASMEVLAELGENSPLARKIHGSYMTFLREADAYAAWFDRPAFAMRSAALKSA
jgi:TRAP-type mannitol/chloroaromatic compound transport system substrate-binding protein